MSKEFNSESRLLLPEGFEEPEKVGSLQNLTRNRILPILGGLLMLMAISGCKQNAYQKASDCLRLKVHGLYSKICDPRQFEGLVNFVKVNCGIEMENKLQLPVAPEQVARRVISDLCLRANRD